MFTTRERYDPFPTRAFYAKLDVVWAKDKVHALHRLEFLIIPHNGVVGA
jgi:hypothetical protein